MAIPAAVYGIIMFFTAAAFGYLVTRRRARVDADAPRRHAGDLDRFAPPGR